MSLEPDENLERLWEEYGQIFADFDDLTLARWMSQTLGQLNGRMVRYSHPLIGAYRMASIIAHDRQIWFKRLVNVPSGYLEADCCRAPVLPIFTRDIQECGLVCHHCNETLAPFEDLPRSLREECRQWLDQYGEHHDVAHWEEPRQAACADYQLELDKARSACNALLLQAAGGLVPQFLELYPVILWEDQDECLGIRPEDLLPNASS